MTEKTKFKTPKELGLTEDQFCALVKTMEGLQSGALVHVPDIGLAAEGQDGFNMGVWSCGSTCCIGGWSERLADLPWGSLADLSGERGMSGLHKLFYDRIGNDITPEQGAKAIQNYLMTGKPQWFKVLK